MRKDKIFGVRAIRRTLTALALAGAFGTPAIAQWTVVNLHPAGAIASRAFGVDGGQQVGYAQLDVNTNHAGLWNGTASSWVDLNPTGATYSYAYGVGGGQQVGQAYVGGVPHASLWSGTAGSWVDLLPAGASESVAWDVDGGQQVGVALVGVIYRASLWTGAATSWVDLHPAGSSYSYAYGVGDGQQVGYAGVGGLRASLWTGSADSWVDLHPAGTDFSVAAGVDGGQEVGLAYVGGDSHASLWNGTAASWVDLNPAGTTFSQASDVDGGQQVGYANAGGVRRASLWSGAAASWVDLHSFLPSDFTSSEARGISHDGNFTYVVGSGYNNTTSRWEALMWVGPGINLTADATCPAGGPISVFWTGATADGRVALVYANITGSLSIPNGPCAGTQLGLGASGIQIVFSGNSGPNGNRTINGTAPGAACGHFLQLLDIATCGTSNVVRIE